jgi:hypothetical protein
VQKYFQVSVQGANPTTSEFTRLERFCSMQEEIFYCKTRCAIRSVVIFYNAGVVTREDWLKVMYKKFIGKDT